MVWFCAEWSERQLNNSQALRVSSYCDQSLVVVKTAWVVVTEGWVVVEVDHLQPVWAKPCHVYMQTHTATCTYTLPECNHRGGRKTGLQTHTLGTERFGTTCAVECPEHRVEALSHWSCHMTQCFRGNRVGVEACCVEGSGCQAQCLDWHEPLLKERMMRERKRMGQPCRSAPWEESWHTEG